MTRHSGDQKGFTLVETLLTVLVVIAVAFAGYYVWHTQKDGAKTPEPTKTSQKASSKPAKDDSNVNYFVISEWGVRAKNDTGITPLYKLDSYAKEVWADFSSKELAALDPECGLESQAGGIIVRTQANDHIYTDSDDDTGQTVLQAIAAGTLSGYKKVDSYYYWYEHSHAACGSASDDVTAAQEKTSNAIKEIVSDLEVNPLNAGTANQ